MKEEILKMFSRFRVNKIYINKDGLTTGAFWAGIINDLPIRVIHNSNVRGVVIFDAGEYPLMGDDLPIGDHLRVIDCIDSFKSGSRGKLMIIGREVMYFDAVDHKMKFSG